MDSRKTQGGRERNSTQREDRLALQLCFSRSQASSVGLLKIHSSGQNPLQSSVRLLKAGTCSDCPQRWHTEIIFKTNRPPESLPVAATCLLPPPPPPRLPLSLLAGFLLSFISSGDTGDEC